MRETPPALCPIQMVSTCGTVMSMVNTERPRKIFSRRETGSELCGWVTQGPSQGSIVMVSLLIARSHGDATGCAHELSDYFTISTPFIAGCRRQMQCISPFFRAMNRQLLSGMKEMLPGTP